ncbi:RNA polymerase sigma-70 factor [bacterium]|nr:RNA polymerase sigma-70 factor [bacterium]
MKSPYHHLSDSQLASAIQASDRESFKLLYYRHHDALYRFLRRRVRSREMAKDLTQEIFLRLWQRRDGLDPDRSLRAYLFQTANNLVIDYLRKQSVEKAHRERQPETEPIDLSGDEFELREKAQQAIRDLPEPLRVVFTFSRFDGLKHRQISEILGISIRTVESRMSHALEILRNKLAPYLSLSLFVDLF